ncbi:MAG: hypothetical protein U9R13_07195 [Campylobacterota bacterium]|nr:hypothetical protein [Campylobacterota bacterium]
MKKIILSIVLYISWMNAETSYVDKAMEALKEISTEQVGKIELTANSTDSKNEKNLKGFVLSTQIKTFSDIPKNIDYEISNLKEETRLLIRQIALDIEAQKENKSGSLSLTDTGNLHYEPNPNLPDDLNKKRKKLLEADLQNSVSIRSAYLALNLLASVNNEIITQAKEARGRKAKEQLYMKQAIYVYEISDIVLTLLNELTLEGTNSIQQLHREAQDRVNANIKNIAKQKKKAKALKEQGIITALELDKELSSLTLIAEASKRSLHSWKGILGKIGSQEQYLASLKLKKEFIAYKQNKAKIQIETLRDLRGVATLRDSIGAIDDLVSTVDQLDLLVLDEQVVTELLGGYEYE